MTTTAGLPEIPAHFTAAQLRKMLDNATLQICDARARRNRQREMKFQAAVTAIEARLDTLSLA